MDKAVNASLLAHFIGDMTDSTKPLVVAYEHDERGLQHLQVVGVLETGNALVLKTGPLVDLSALEPLEREPTPNDTSLPVEPGYSDLVISLQPTPILFAFRAHDGDLARLTISHVDLSSNGFEFFRAEHEETREPQAIIVRVHLIDKIPVRIVRFRVGNTAGRFVRVQIDVLEVAPSTVSVP